ncbi:PREDICTED: uncharacterized protein LOC106805854 [Priapulus caudatus]|uniref:Uncharacterized protein LOC106805854 n=1 Tax=Priapulus caudatus TaxID=37621 RepID=A0ABM1DT41_PRICU|nr:PREDICTED: uncharacterized protein LOC106805854 [Priapulus caudatus]
MASYPVSFTQLGVVLICFNMLLFACGRTLAYPTSALEQQLIDDPDKWSDVPETAERLSSPLRQYVLQELDRDSKGAGVGSSYRVQKRFGSVYQRPQRNRYSVRCLLNPITCFGRNQFRY